MSTTEERLSQALHRAAPALDGVELDAVGEAVRRRRATRATAVGIGTSVTAVAAVAVAAVMVLGPPRSVGPAPTLAPADGVDGVDLSGTVPWTDAPATEYEPPTVADVRPCLATDLSPAMGQGEGATGHVLQPVLLTNVSQTPCLLEGYPAAVVATEPGLPDVTATNGSYFPDAPSAALAPGEVANLGVQTDNLCEAWPGGVETQVLYHHLSVTLAGDGGTVEVEVPGGVETSCGVQLTHFYTSEAAGAPVDDPLARLSVALDLPRSVTAGTTLVYVVTLTNSSDQPIALDRCPSYVEAATGATETTESYALTCTGVGPIAAGASVRFEMHLAVPADAAAGAAAVSWALVAPFDVSATGTVRVVRPDAPSSASGDAVAPVSGILEMVGGPIAQDGTTRRDGVPGTVTATETSTGRTYEATADADGHFAVDVPVGTYEFTGTSPTYGDATYQCTAGDPLTVRDTGVTDVDVICAVP